ncbi:MAG TPA: PPC domain-containing DNA-binding protein [Acetobacteraceae bacterium]|nr:PPC domain-containing DNA-binding protein [Acetobacteraceae bacterium]
MKSRLINEGPQRTFAVVFSTGEEFVSGFAALVREQGITSAAFTGLGALSRVVLGYFDWERKEYRKISFDEQVEVVSLLGNVALDESGKPSVHPHMVIARADATAFGGHVLEAVVRPVIELVVTESPTYLQRRKDAESGLALIRL